MASRELLYSTESFVFMPYDDLKVWDMEVEGRPGGGRGICVFMADWYFTTETNTL